MSEEYDDINEYYDDSDYADYDEEEIENEYYDDIDLENIDVGEQLADEWYDETDDQSWTILNEVEDEFNDEWEDDELWDEISPKIKTISGHMMQRKCMNIFGRKLCLCEFLNWVKFGTTKHQCGRKKVIVKKRKMIKKQKIMNKRKMVKKTEND